ncbi:VanZ family protein [Micromonospora coxensis]|uniref:VanZ like family protein n=1 Tax=Micromonospora coxensis TaxID=356852 RepID=A0A1C5IS58_9ACTN|nr:VanZ family protein [Micromonospora coxensis]SCG60831.1 VanZ like family protein [Micromonospora coxensis]
MGQVWRDWGDVLLATLVAVPVTVLLTALLARRRRDAPTREEAWWRSAAEIGMVAGTLPWVWMILTPRDAPGEVKLVPLVDIVDLADDGASTFVVQVVGNLLVFAALGFLAPVRAAALAGVGRLFLLGAAGSVLVESLQYALDLGRVTSVDDVLLNASGAALAGLLSRRWWAGRRPAPQPPVTVPATSRAETVADQSSR